MRPRREEWRRRTCGVLVMTLMLAWAVAPAVHAQFEVAAAAPAVEAGHSDQCPRIHTDVLCLAGSTFQFPTQSIDHGMSELDHGRVMVLPTTDWLCFAPSTRHGVPSDRAPPTL